MPHAAARGNASTQPISKSQPILKSEGIFRQKGKLTIWLTCDDLKVPVKMKSKVTIGSISTNLEKYATGVIQ